MTIHEQMESKFAQVGIPYHDLRVFGAIRTNVHIRCVGRDSAEKWVTVLHRVFDGAKVVMVETAWEAKVNRNTVLSPSYVRGWLVAVAA